MAEDGVDNRRAKSLVLRYFEMWNTGDTSAAHEVMSPGCVDHAHPAQAGPASLSEAIRAGREDDPSVHVFVDAVLGDREMITVVGRVRTAETQSVRDRVWTFRVEDAIAEIWTYGGRR